MSIKKQHTSRQKSAELVEKKRLHQPSFAF